MPYAQAVRKCHLHSPGRYFGDMQTAGDRLKLARERAGFETARAGAERVGVPYDTYAQHENGTRGVPKNRVEVYARAFGVEPQWILYGRGPANGGRKTVPLVGYVGAGAVAHYYEPADLGEVDAPDNATENTVAAEIRGTSLGPLFESWLVYYDEVRTPVTPDLIGRMCVVGLPDGRVLVKLLRKSSARGRYHLLSNNEEPILDQEVVWAARVKSMTPR